MPDRLKELLASLKDTMQALQEYPQELNDWMLSNHNYIKTDSPDLVNYLPEDAIKDLKKVQQDKDFQERKKSTVKIKNADGEVEEVEVEKIQSEEKTNEFFKRAEVIKNPRSGSSKNNNSNNSFGSAAEKTAHIKEMAKQIKKAGSAGITTEGNSILLSPEMLENADPDVVSEFQSLIDGGETYSPMQDDSRDDIAIPSHVLRLNQQIAAKRKAGGEGSLVSDSEDLAKIQERVNNPGANLGKGCFGRG
jgi:hypothetical protein